MVPLVGLLQLVCFLLLSSSSAAGSAPGNDHHDLLMLDRFHRWMAFHDRSYPNDDEKLRRFEVYRHNVEYIERTNQDGGLGYQLGENDFTDLTNEEFVARYIGGLIVDDSKVITTLAGDVSEGYVVDGGEDDPAKLQIAPPRPPKNVDWREKGAVTNATNQGKCGSCWAFAAVATVESMHQIATGKLVKLSEQEVMDCYSGYPLKGCKGGEPLDALQKIKQNRGVMTEESYGQYKGQQLTCRSFRKTDAGRVGKIKWVRKVSSETEEALTLAVAHQPVAVAIDGNNTNIQHYTSGIYTGPCTTELNHAVVVVGYGREAVSAVDYWIVKNSWGSNWGQNGFFFMRKGADGPYGLCGIVKERGVYPQSCLEHDDGVSWNICAKD
ncbi:hypothetical protein GUJ93_ZPchr0458g22362 [Zizania palustris]|uniref:Uncharacterized protein n=1 Tax=Zizania palustris TaxID=103762 RepID=A0A8J5UUV0_ZIZPA|nr:hypothetical protein GUJ93_ZPchr0458g22362 [Zizania palustris]